MPPDHLKILVATVTLTSLQENSYCCVLRDFWGLLESFSCCVLEHGPACAVVCNPAVLGACVKNIFWVILSPLICPACEVRLWGVVRLGWSTWDVLNLPLTKHCKVVWAFVPPGRGLGGPGCWVMLTKKEEQLPRGREEVVGPETLCLRWSKGVFQNGWGNCLPFSSFLHTQPWKGTAATVGCAEVFCLSGSRVLKAGGSAEFLNMLYTRPFCREFYWARARELLWERSGVV